MKWENTSQSSQRLTENISLIIATVNRASVKIQTPNKCIPMGLTGIQFPKYSTVTYHMGNKALLCLLDLI